MTRPQQSAIAVFSALQEIRQRWTQLSEDSREVIADAVASVPLHADGQQQLLPQLHLALDAAGESWHRSFAKGSGATNSAGADGPNPAVVAKWQQRAAQACEDAAAALAARPADVTSQMLLRPLSLLALGYIGGAPLKVGAVPAAWHGFWRVVPGRLAGRLHSRTLHHASVPRCMRCCCCYVHCTPPARRLQ